MKKPLCIPVFKDFEVFSKVGKSLAGLYLNTETGPSYSLGEAKYRHQKFGKISFGKKKSDSDVTDKTILMMNDQVIFDNVPETNYKVCGKTLIEFVIEQHNSVINKVTSIIDDPDSEFGIISLIEKYTCRNRI